MPLPESVLRAHVWPRVHQLRLRGSLQAIQRAGPSFFEDMPDLSYGDDLVSFCDQSPGFRGWSQRVNEFRDCVHTGRRADCVRLVSPPRRKSIYVPVTVDYGPSSESSES